MPAELSLEILPEEVAQVVASTFETMLRLEVNAGGPEWFPSRERLTAAVHLTGKWNGAVLLECSREEACRLTGHFLSIEAPAAVDDIVRDVLGELANIIGGNLKCVLMQGMRLSMPSTVDGNYSLCVCGAEVRERIAFQCAEGPFWITILATHLGLERFSARIEGR